MNNEIATYSSTDKWKLRLKLELDMGSEFKGLKADEWNLKLSRKRLVNDNYDTVISLDWPHYCSHATKGCGGPNGWCYTLGGQIGGNKARSLRAAMTDRLARDYPDVFAEIVHKEILQFVKNKKINYPNIRFSGSGEVHQNHFAALIALKNKGVQLWGFSRNPKFAIELQEHGISVLFSCDATTPEQNLEYAKNNGLKLAYTSLGVSDVPKFEAFVVFPVHRSGRVREIADTRNVCPKISQEFLTGKRKPASCQKVCTLCHKVK
jgi:hypothetical protein